MSPAGAIGVNVALATAAVAAREIYPLLGRGPIAHEDLAKVLPLLLHSPLLPRVQRRLFFGAPLPPLDPASASGLERRGLGDGVRPAFVRAPTPGYYETASAVVDERRIPASSALAHPQRTHHVRLRWARACVLGLLAPRRRLEGPGV
jgi:hypothetical protein